MSLITDMVLFTSGWDGDAVSRLNDWCSERDARGQQFRLLDAKNGAGGTKVFCSGVYAMAGNYFPWYDLGETVLTSFEWKTPSLVVLVISPEAEDGVTILRPSHD